VAPEVASGLHKERVGGDEATYSQMTKMSNFAENLQLSERKQGLETMRTNLATVLDPNRRSNDAS